MMGAIIKEERSVMCTFGVGHGVRDLRWRDGAAMATRGTRNVRFGRSISDSEQKHQLSVRLLRLLKMKCEIVIGRTAK